MKKISQEEILRKTIVDIVDNLPPKARKEMIVAIMKERKKAGLPVQCGEHSHG